MLQQCSSAVSLQCILIGINFFFLIQEFFKLFLSSSSSSTIQVISSHFIQNLTSSTFYFLKKKVFSAIASAMLALVHQFSFLWLAADFNSSTVKHLQHAGFLHFILLFFFFFLHFYCFLSLKRH